MILLLTACLISAPGDCVTDRLPLADATTPTACLMLAQPALARWVAEHPNRKIVRWTCRPNDEREA